MLKKFQRIRTSSLLVTVALTGLMTIGIASAQSPQKRTVSTKSDSGFAVVELFTSQGCSSCPSADENLAAIAKQAEQDGKKVRAIFEERSHHVTIGLKYLPAIARRLHHCRDLAEIEPFDFLTLFDYTQESESAFNDMLAELRTTEEWKFIEREVDIRLIKA